MQLGVFGVAPAPPCTLVAVRFMKGRSEWPDSCSQDMFLGCSLSKREGQTDFTWAHMFFPHNMIHHVSPFFWGEDSFYDSKIIVSAEHWELHPTLLGGFSVLPSIQTYLPRTSLGVFVTLKRIRTSYDDQSWPKGWWLNSRFYPYVCINLPTKNILGSMVFAVAVVFFVFVFQ